MVGRTAVRFYHPWRATLTIARVRRILTPYAFIAPFYLLFLAFGFLPLIGSFGMSLYAWRGVRPGRFIGFDNYAALNEDPAFWRAFLNTGLLWIATVPTITFVALVLAVILDSKRLRFRSLFRGAFFLPVLTSLVVAAWSLRSCSILGMDSWHCSSTQSECRASTSAPIHFLPFR